MSLTASSAAALSMGSVAHGLSSLGEQVLTLKNLLGSLNKESVDLSLGEHGDATVRAPGSKVEHPVAVNFHSGGKFRVAFNSRGGATGDLSYMSQELAAFDPDSWELAGVISFGFRDSKVPGFQTSVSPETAPTFYRNGETGGLYGDTLSSILNVAGQSFNGNIHGPLLNMPKDANALATLVKEVLPAITALNTALRNSLNS
jgi:hypothetical protein